MKVYLNELRRSIGQDLELREDRSRSRVLAALQLEASGTRGGIPVRRFVLATACALTLLVALVPSRVWVSGPEIGPDAYDALLLDVEHSLNRDLSSAFGTAVWPSSEVVEDLDSQVEE